MTEKRFNIVGNYVYDGYDCISHFEDTENRNEIVDKMNELHEENQTFREALKELKEIGDYQAMRIRELDDMNSLIEDEIDKKIVLLTDAEIECIQTDNKELYGKVKFSIQVLRELKEVILND